MKKVRTGITPHLSTLYQNAKESAIRIAGMMFAKRTDKVMDYNLAIGNVSLPMHIRMRLRMLFGFLFHPEFWKGIMKYSGTIGLPQTKKAFLKYLEALGVSVKGLYIQITTAGTQAMRLAPLGTCGDVDGVDRPLLIINPFYTNYAAIAKQIKMRLVSVTRTLMENGMFSQISLLRLEEEIKKHNPGAILIVLPGNPDGQSYTREWLVGLAKLSVKYGFYIISDEAYLGLQYDGEEILSIFNITEEEVPGITGWRIGIYTASKGWNGCGLRVGALVTDNEEMHEKALAEATAELCPPVPSQFIFAAVAKISLKGIRKWFEKLRVYYGLMLKKLTEDLKEELPELIVSKPIAALYVVIDGRKLMEGFDMSRFVMWAAEKGNYKGATVIVAMMAPFYHGYDNYDENPGKSQARLAAVLSKKKMAEVPAILAGLLREYVAEQMQLAA